jgi:hypothetical protein
LYYAMLYPSWAARAWIPRPWGSVLFFPVLGAVAVAANLRLHLWFTSRFNPAELAAQRGRVFRWIRASDVILVFLFVLMAAAIADMHTAVATSLSPCRSVCCSFAIIEPATTRARSTAASLPSHHETRKRT